VVGSKGLLFPAPGKLTGIACLPSAHDAWGSIAQLADVVIPSASTRVDFLAEAKSGAFDGCYVAYRTFDSFSFTGRLDAELLDAMPSSLRYICHSGAGYDQIDISACSARGIRVSNTPTAVDDATADTNMFLILGALRNLNASMVNLRAGTWRGNPPPALGHDPQGKVLGILGMGGIGRNLAKKALAFGMKVRYYNRTRLAPELESDCGAEYVDFDCLLKESDVLSLNLPLNVSIPIYPWPLAPCHGSGLTTRAQCSLTLATSSLGPSSL
jgi:hypothetical protein